MERTFARPLVDSLVYCVPGDARQALMLKSLLQLTNIAVAHRTRDRISSGMIAFWRDRETLQQRFRLRHLVEGESVNEAWIGAESDQSVREIWNNPAPVVDNAGRLPATPWCGRRLLALGGGDLRLKVCPFTLGQRAEVM
jgi:hypothetical protein